MQHWGTAGNEEASVPQGAMLGGGRGVSGLRPFSAWLSPEGGRQARWKHQQRGSTRGFLEDRNSYSDLEDG